MKNRLLGVWCWLLLSLPVSAQNWDIDLLRQANLQRNSVLDPTFRTLTNTAVPVVAIGTSLLLGSAYLGHDSLRRRQALSVAASVAATAVLTTLLKYAVHRPRPFVTYPDIQPLAEGGGPSFPSGHTSTAFGFATALSLNYPRWYVIAPALVWAGSVGYSRLHLGVHYPSDVVTGAVLGAGTAFLNYKLNRYLARRYARPSRSSTNHRRQLGTSNRS